MLLFSSSRRWPYSLAPGSETRNRWKGVIKMMRMRGAPEMTRLLCPAALRTCTSSGQLDEWSYLNALQFQQQLVDEALKLMLIYKIGA